jgi:hypothetical protein
MPVNDPYIELTPISSAKANNMMIIGLTGAQITSLSPTYPGQKVFCNTTGSGFTINHWYGRNAANDAWIDEGTDAYALYSDNQLVQVLDKRFATKEMWHNTVVNTGTITNLPATGRISLATGTNATGSALLSIGGPTLDFGKKAVLKVKIKTDPTAITGQIVKIGVDVDTAGTGPVTINMFGIEFCDGNANWQIHSANGTTQSNYDTLKPVAAATVYSFTIEFTPTTGIDVTFNDGVVKTKTTHIPSSGTCTTQGVLKISIANNNANTTSRVLEVLAAWMVYKTNDANWLEQ